MGDASTALWIKNVRRRAGFATQAALAEALGISRGAVGNWEIGEGVPTMAHAERFATVTHRSRAEVLAKFGYPIGGGDPAPEAPLPSDWTTAIEKAVSRGIAAGVEQVLDQLRREGLLSAPDRAGGRLPRRRSA